MATKKFNIQFEDIRRNTTPVTAAGFGSLVEDPDNPDEPFIDVDLNEEDLEKAVTAATGTSNGAEGAGAGDDERDRKRAALRAKKDARAAADEAIGEARAEVAVELNTLHEKIDALENAKGLTKVEEEYDTAKAGIEAKMVTAMEDGKSETYATLNSELIELNGKMSEKRMELRAQSTEVVTPEDLGGAAADRQPANPRAVAFIQVNEAWWSDPDHEDAVDYAKRLDKKLVNMGYDPKSDRYWHAFNRTFDNKFEDLRVADDDEIEIDIDTGGKGKGNRSPVHRPGSGGGASRGAANRGGGDGGGGEGAGKGTGVVRLTAADKANMTRFLLDPSNPEHCRQYAMNKVPEERT